MKSMMSFLAITLTAVFSFPPSQTGITFTSERQSIQYGQETTLHWKVEGADSVFISGLGSVPLEGTRVVRPKNTTEYTLVTEGPSIGGVAKLKVVVEGARGPDDYPKDLERFRYPKDFEMTSSAVNQLGRIHGILQDDMHFSVKEYQEGENFFFLTNSSERDYLIDPSETRIRARYISYLVRVGKQDAKTKAIPITVSSMIEYVKGGESTRKLEGSDALYEREAARLRAKITGRP